MDNKPDDGFWLVLGEAIFNSFPSPFYPLGFLLFLLWLVGAFG